MTTYGRHKPFYMAALAGALAGLSAVAVAPLTALIIAANTFFAVFLAASLRRLSAMRGHAVRVEAARSDLPVWLIFTITLGAVVAALVALFVMLNADAAPRLWILVLAMLAVPLGWMTIHMMAAIHYAHLYWQARPDAEPARGIAFPGTRTPAGIDFIYFAFVIGMTAQTSDVDITASDVRAMALVHGIVSFFFNTVLVAAAVNAAVTLSN